MNMPFHWRCLICGGQMDADKAGDVIRDSARAHSERTGHNDIKFWMDEEGISTQ